MCSMPKLGSHHCLRSAGRFVDPFTVPLTLIATVVSAAPARGQCTPPVITVQPHSQVVAPGQTVELRIEWAGTVSGIAWRKNGIQLADPPPYQSWFVIPDVGPDDSGTYDAVLTSNCGNAVSEPAVVSVEACSSAWQGGFGSPNELSGTTIAVFDDGGGPALFAPFHDEFTSTGSRLFKWRPDTGWRRTRAQFHGSIDTMKAVSFDGDSALLAAGNIYLGGSPNRIAGWDGRNWRLFGSGFNNTVRAMAALNGGPSAVLFAGGCFTASGSTPINRVASWDGENWVAVGSGFSQCVNALTEFDDGAGPALYAGGAFTASGGTPVSRVAKWSGLQWLPLGVGVSGTVTHLVVLNERDGASLIAAGEFTTAGNLAANHVARWRDGAWSALGDATLQAVRALTVHDAGRGPEVYVAGHFITPGSALVQGVARLDGDHWELLPGPIRSSGLNALASYHDQVGPALFLSGFGLFQAGEVYALSCVAKYGDGQWSVMDQGGGDPGNLGTLQALCEFQGSLYAGGELLMIAGRGAEPVLRWTGAGWSRVGTDGPGAESYGGTATDLAVFDDGSGPALFAGGFFNRVGSTPSGPLVKWDGNRWWPTATDLGIGYIRSLTVYDDGRGPALYGVALRYGGDPSGAWMVARWDGTSWSTIATSPGGFLTIRTLDLGDGPALYLGGSFTHVEGIPTGPVAKWDGRQWSRAADDAPYDAVEVWALSDFDDGLGPQLHIGGFIADASDYFGVGVLRWDGKEWSLLNGTVCGLVQSFTECDDEHGRSLYAGGYLFEAGGQPALDVARWDGNEWSRVGFGVYSMSDGSYGPGVYDMKWFDDGSGPSLFVAGQFDTAGGHPSSNIARWIAAEPAFSRHPSDTLVAESQHAEFSVAVRTPTPVAYQWYRDMQPLSDGGRISGARSARLTIRPVEIGDAGGYHCVVENGCTNADSRPAMLTVYRRGDQNGDAVVDAADYTLFAACLNGGLGGPGGEAGSGGSAGSGGPGGNGGAAAGDPADACRLSDLDDNGVVDCADWAIFRSLWNPPRHILLPPCDAQMWPEPVSLIGPHR